MSTCASVYLDTTTEALHPCTRPAHHDGHHVSCDADDGGAPPLEWNDERGVELYGQVRGDLAPAPPRTDSWSPAAAASIAAGALQHPQALEDRWARYDATAAPRERSAALMDRLIADAIRLGEQRERAAATQRVYAWAATLSNVREALIAAKAAEVVQAGR